MNNKKGQSIIEAIMLVAGMAIILTGAALLFVQSINLRTKSFDRKKAVEMSDILIESLIAKKNSDPDQFWLLAPEDGKVLDGYSQYIYSIGYTDSPACANSRCTEAVLTIRLTADIGQTMVFSRLFSR